LAQCEKYAGMSMVNKASAGPLSGLRVVDLTRYLSGPYTTMILGDLGAEIIKIENPDGGDFSRHVGPFANGVSTYFLSINRGKKSVAVDLKNKHGRDIVLDLISTADVVVENFIPGTAARLGLGFGDAKRRNQKIVFASCSGFGQTGPYSGKPAFDMLIQGMAGTVSITGEPDRPPVRVGFSIGDIGAALFLATGILAALQQRDRTGEAQWVDVAMLDCQVALLENAFSRFLNVGEVPQREGYRHPVSTPVQIIETLDGYMCLAVANDQQWRKLCLAVGRAELAEDQRFQTNSDRTKNRQELESILVDVTKKRRTSEWVELLEANGVPAGPVDSIDAVATNPQVIAREMIAAVDHPVAGTLQVVNSPIRFDGGNQKPSKASPLLGEHTGEVLRNLLHLTQAQIDELAELGAIAPRENREGNQPSKQAR
jgi:CoA:oxalate CoA-transferase